MMRSTLRARRRAAALLFLGCLFTLACGDSGTSPPVEHPLQFRDIVHPFLVAPGSPVGITAGVYAGSDLCWGVKEASVQQNGNVLTLRGTALRRDGAGACATALAYDSLTLFTAPLQEGTYVLVADSLVDTLIVTGAIPTVPPPLNRFAAHGTACPKLGVDPEACAFFTGTVLRQLRGRLDPPPPIDRCLEARVYGSVGGTTTCNAQPARILQFRRMQIAPVRRSLFFEYFIHPYALDTNSPGRLQAGVLVGLDGCWRLEAASLARRGDSLIVSGTGIYDETFPPHGCTDMLVYDTLSVAIPPLDSGRYLIVAGQLRDTLVVASPAPDIRGPGFTAFGCIDTTDPACAHFRCEYGGFTAVEGFVTNSLTPGPNCHAILTGNITGRVTCGGDESNALRWRAVTWMR